MGFINKLYEKFATRSVHLNDAEVDVTAWEKHLEGLPAGGDSVTISHNKYTCWIYSFSPAKRVVLNCAGLLSMALELPIMLFAKPLNKTVKELLVVEKHAEVEIDDVIPEELLDAYPEKAVIGNIGSKFGTVSKEIRQYVFRCIRRYPGQFFYHYYIFKELLAHHQMISRYSPKTVAVYANERNIALPILKELYSSQGRKLVSFMHGEYLLQINQAFMAFHDYYIWDNSYIDMFSNFLKCDIDRYHLYVPRKLQKKWNLETIQPEYKYTYYFSNESREAVKIIADAFNALSGRGIRCKVRPHPRFLVNFQEIAKDFSGIDIENPREISMKDSLARTEYAIGLNTTVLFEAEAEGRKIVLDDLSDKRLYGSLRARRFRLLEHEHLLFSEIMDRENISMN